ncbi:hypothetical protein K2173_025584 [Erythroxylum novogranatense]|uniref:AB hydrolase-1 domain-containing protein n=1 Tax=Erythroxylum novogranatense TaxID=1862640 RepID=A0AAV8TB72_9ROSI|nr:hypothetical protein K2173_025584 [Erythroxylum novogranatense]
MSPVYFPVKCASITGEILINAVSYTVFLVLDFLDVVFCIIYRYLDEILEGKPSPCCCRKRGGLVESGEETEVSETLYERRNVFREMGFVGFPRKWEDCRKPSGIKNDVLVNRWSDCGCESCLSWMEDRDKLHVEVKLPPKAAMEQDCREGSSENVIFIHGFLSSSSFWTETVFPNLSEPVKQSYRLIAVDLLGFGRSPKPRQCLYTLSDHVEMIEKSVIDQLEVKSFHLVAHSMGCIIASALAAKYPKCVKSITLVAPPYFSKSKEGASLVALTKLARKMLWPPIPFGSAFMSWYEHLGRCVCLLICRNHRTWERILKLLTWRRDLHFMIRDFTRHTHHSAWHTMHNVICGGAKFMDDFLEILMNFGVKVFVIQGQLDLTVPLECSEEIKRKVPEAEVCIVSNADHRSVIMGREKEITEHLEHIWASVADVRTCLEDENGN